MDELKVCLMQSAIDHCLAPCEGERCALMGKLFAQCGIAVEARWKGEKQLDGKYNHIFDRKEVGA